MPFFSWWILPGQWFSNQFRKMHTHIIYTNRYPTFLTFDWLSCWAISCLTHALVPRNMAVRARNVESIMRITWYYWFLLISVGWRTVIDAASYFHTELEWIWSRHACFSAYPAQKFSRDPWLTSFLPWSGRAVWSKMLRTLWRNPGGGRVGCVLSTAYIYT